MTKRQLFERGKVHVHHWCGLNGVKEPEVVECDSPVAFGTCAYYRAGVIFVSVDECAAVGMGGRAWSFPGYVVDRTPYGVLCHELGHHVDEAEGTRGGVHSKAIFEALCGPKGVCEAKLTDGDPNFYHAQLEVNVRVEPISGYHDNVLEWFAEAFRLFVTNPYLLAALRPEVFAEVKRRWPRAAEERSWQRILALVPRQLKAAENKVAAVRRRRPREVTQGSLP